jgi:hypothetical protein
MPISTFSERRLINPVLRKALSLSLVLVHLGPFSEYFGLLVHDFHPMIKIAHDNHLFC